MLVSDVMTLDPAYLNVTSTVREAHRIMTELDVRHLPIVSNNQVVGVISDRDLRAFMLDQLQAQSNPTENQQRLDQHVSVVTAYDPLRITPETPVPEAIDMMLGYKISAVPVVEKKTGSLVGMLSYVDLLFKAREFFE